jgi:hypothetical protein
MANIVDPRFTKAVSSSLTVQAEYIDDKIIDGIDLLYTLCDRNATTNNRGNYFVSFGLPTSYDMLSTGSTIAKYFPELYQMNVDKFIMVQIPFSAYSEYLDGRGFTLNVPTGGGPTALKLVSSTYSSDKPLKYGETSPLLGDNITFLFSDEINKPYSGFTATEMGVRSNMSGNTTWEPDLNDFTKRPSAVSYREVLGGGISPILNPFGIPNGLNTDKRPSPNWSVTPPTNFPDGVAGYNYDVPCGFCILDKGICVITHTAITNDFSWTAGLDLAGNTPSGEDEYVNIYFANSAVSSLEYVDMNTSFKTTAICLAMPQEFWISNNGTWDRSAALNNLNSQTGILTINPVYVTEVGLYNQMNELIAVAKLSDYVEKTYINLVTFNIDIDM